MRATPEVLSFALKGTMPPVWAPYGYVQHAAPHSFCTELVVLAHVDGPDAQRGSVTRTIRMRYTARTKSTENCAVVTSFGLHSPGGTAVESHASQRCLTARL